MKYDEIETNTCQNCGSELCFLCNRAINNSWKYLCYDCYNKALSFRDLVSKTMSQSDINQEYTTILNQALQETNYDPNVITYCQQLIGIAKKAGYLPNCDSSLMNRLNNDIKKIIDTKKPQNLSEKIFSHSTDSQEVDFRQKYPATIRCEDGHYVRSKSEQIIDQYLYSHNIRHCYEKIYPVSDTIQFTPDFYLPDLKLYIEYFGRNEETYLEKTEKKINYYNKDKENRFVYLYPSDDNIINDKLDIYISTRIKELKK